jgi:AmmeMemoRadiSam system protein A
VTSIDEVGPELPKIARSAIRAHLLEGRATREPSRDTPPAGVFVTLRNADGSLRGCIGSIAPVMSDLVAETSRSAVLAATRDPRFPPVTIDELPALRIEVSVLGPEEPAAGLDDLDPRVFGVIVRDRAGRRGLLLPDIEGVDEPEQQVQIARRKAGIAASEPVVLSRFRVRKFCETK